MRRELLDGFYPSVSVAEQKQSEQSLQEQQQLGKQIGVEDPLKSFEGLTLPTFARFKPCCCPVNKVCDCD